MKVYDNLKLKIPRNLPPSGFPHCEFIDCSYFVHAVAKTAKINDDIVVKLPLIIMAGEDADTELDDDDPFEAGLNILVHYLRASQAYKMKVSINTPTNIF